MENAWEYQVFYNDVPLKFVVDAHDGEGWIEVLDEHFIASIAPALSYSEGNTVDEGDPEVEVDVLPAVRRYGKVEFRKVGHKVLASK